MIRQTLTSKEKVDIIPVDIVHEATYDENIPVPWAFTDQIHLGYKSYVGHLKREKSALIVEFLNNVITVKMFLLKQNIYEKNICPFVQRGKE